MLPGGGIDGMVRMGCESGNPGASLRQDQGWATWYAADPSLLQRVREITASTWAHLGVAVTKAPSVELETYCILKLSTSYWGRIVLEKSSRMSPASPRRHQERLETGIWEQRRRPSGTRKPTS